MPVLPNRRSRRCVKFESDDDSSSEDGGAPTPAPTGTQAKIAQIKIMTEDLGSLTRDKMTAQDAGPKAKHVHLAALRRSRDCNQEGSEANVRAMQNKQALNNWSNYGDTTDAKTAGFENLPDMAAGNSHRERMRRELQEQGVTELEDTYDEPRIPPAFRNRAGAAAAMANDRGRYDHARGGGNAGRGMGRGASMAARSTGRPLDPAVDPDRPYAYKNKGTKKKPVIKGEMVQGTVVVKTTDKQSSSKKKPGQYSSPRLDRGPLPDHVRQPITPVLASSATFEAAVLAMFKKKVEGGKVIMAEPHNKSVNPTIQPVASTNPDPAHPELAERASFAVPKASPKVQHIEREELGLMNKSPDAFTDGNPTPPNQSGFTPSLASQDEAPTVGKSMSGLGIQGAIVHDVAGPSLTLAADLMDAEVPGAKNASLTPPLQVSPRDSHFESKDQYEEYKTLKEFQAFVESRPSQDFTQWLNQRKPSQPMAQAATKEIGKHQNTSPVDISVGYTIGATQLGRILGDDKNVAAKTRITQTTQTTPGLAQSKWASPEVKLLSSFKECSQESAQGDSKETGSVLKKTELKLETIEETSMPLRSSQSTLLPAKVANGVTSSRKVSAGKASETQIGSFATQGAREPHDDRGGVVTAKPVNPFAPREDPGSFVAQLPVNQSLGTAAEPKETDSNAAHNLGAGDVKQRPREGRKIAQPRAPVKKGLASSKWSTETLGPSGVVYTAFQGAEASKSNMKTASIFGDSKNVPRPSGVLASVPVNTFTKTLKTSIWHGAERGPQEPDSSKKALPRPVPGLHTQASLPHGLFSTQGGPIVSSPNNLEPITIIGDTKNVQKSDPSWARDPASQSAWGIEKKVTAIKRSNAGPGYDWLMREQQAKKQTQLAAEANADGPEDVKKMVNLTHQFRDLYVGADDSDEEL